MKQTIHPARVREEEMHPKVRVKKKGSSKGYWRFTLLKKHKSGFTQKCVVKNPKFFH